MASKPAQFAYETLRELRYDVWQAVRAGRSVSRVEAIEALLTMGAPGHRIHPVQVSGTSHVVVGFDNLTQLAHRAEDCQHRPVDGSDSVGGYPGQHWVEVDCTTQFACRWHSVRSS